MDKRAGLARFMRSLLTMGSGETPWLVIAFVCGALALGVFADLIYDGAAHRDTLSGLAVAFALAAVAILVVVAYLAYRRDLTLAWRAGRFITNIREETAQPCSGLIWMLSLRASLDLPLIAMRHHLGPEGKGPLQHCWVLVTPDVREEGAYVRLQERVNELPCRVSLHSVELDSDTTESAYQAIEQVLIRGIHSDGANLQPAQVIADITGGTKAMTAGMVLACLPHQVRLEYVSSQRDPQTGQYKDGTQRPVVVNLDFWRQH